MEVNSIKHLATKEDYANTFKSLKRLMLALFIILALLILGLYIV